LNILNVGCGGRPHDKASYFGDVRIDIRHFAPVTMLMDAHSLGFRDEVFDRIVCFEALEHLDSPVKALKEFRRILKDEGDVVISVPNVWYWRRLLRFLIKKQKALNENPYKDHRYAWDVFEFCGLAYNAGFRVTNAKWLDWYPKGKLKLGILEPFFRSIPQIAFIHVMFRLQKRRNQWFSGTKISTSNK